MARYSLPSPPLPCIYWCTNSGAASCINVKPFLRSLHRLILRLRDGVFVPKALTGPHHSYFDALQSTFHRETPTTTYITHIARDLAYSIRRNGKLIVKIALKTYLVTLTKYKLFSLQVLKSSHQIIFPVIN